MCEMPKPKRPSGVPTPTATVREHGMDYMRALRDDTVLRQKNATPDADPATHLPDRAIQGSGWRAEVEISGPWI